jgi:hypothetical protein
MPIKRDHTPSWLNSATEKIVDALCDLDDITADRPLVGNWEIKSELYRTSDHGAYVEAYCEGRYIGVTSIYKMDSHNRKHLDKHAAKLYEVMTEHEASL